MDEAEVDKRVKIYVEMEDPDIVFDLHELQSGKASKFDLFWDECKKFLQDVELAVDERRHTEVVHVAHALSVRDLREQVSSRYPPPPPHQYLPYHGFLCNFGLRMHTVILACTIPVAFL